MVDNIFALECSTELEKIKKPAMRNSVRALKKIRTELRIRRKLREDAALKEMIRSSISTVNKDDQSILTALIEKLEAYIPSVFNAPALAMLAFLLAKPNSKLLD